MDRWPAELKSGFGEKVLGNVDTEYKILIPNISTLALSQQECTPISPLQSPMPDDDARSSLERISKVAEAAGHFPNIHLEQPNQVGAEVWTTSIAGLSMDDFIVAAKIDEIKTSDLVPKKRVWA